VEIAAYSNEYAFIYDGKQTITEFIWLWDWKWIDVIMENLDQSLVSTASSSTIIRSNPHTIELRRPRRNFTGVLWRHRK
jgi:hypothetical protein